MIMSQTNTTNLSDTTFIIPLRIESQDRLRNVITSLCYLCSNFDTQIIIREVSEEPVFRHEALPQIQDFCGYDLPQIKYDYIETGINTFHRQKIINQMLRQVTTKVTANYDCDILLPKESYVDSVNLILNGNVDVVYPYGDGIYQKQVFANDEIVSQFLTSDFDFKILDKSSKNYDAKYGFVQFFNTESYRNGGGENENFVAYAPEDVERYYRFNTLGYKISRLDRAVYHLEHSRTPNSWFSNPYREPNELEWNKVSQMNKEQLEQYIKESKFYQ